MGRRTVLIVEDHPGLAATLVGHVESWGARAIVAPALDDVIAHRAHDEVCVVLLDAMTPGVQRPELYYSLRQGVPIVLVPVAVSARPPDWKPERDLVAPELLERLIREHCASDEAELLLA